MIEVKNISKKFNNNVVLNGIDLNINKGDVVALIGPSGIPGIQSLFQKDSIGKCNGRPDHRKENGQEKSRRDRKRTA